MRLSGREGSRDRGKTRPTQNIERMCTNVPFNVKLQYASAKCTREKALQAEIDNIIDTSKSCLHWITLFSQYRSSILCRILC